MWSKKCKFGTCDHFDQLVGWVPGSSGTLQEKPRAPSETGAVIEISSNYRLAACAACRTRAAWRIETPIWDGLWSIIKMQMDTRDRSS